MDTTFLLHTDASTPAKAKFSTSAPSELNNKTRGDTASFTLEIQGDKTIPSGGSFTVPEGVTEYYGVLTVEETATLTIHGTVFAEVVNDEGSNITVSDSGELNFLDTVAGVSELLDLDEYAGKHSIDESFRGTQYYKEFTPDSVSLVVGVEPNQALQDREIPGVWGLISNVTDERNTALNTNRLTVDVTVLAPFGEYADVTAVQNTLETQ